MFIIHTIVFILLIGISTDDEIGANNSNDTSYSNYSGPINENESSNASSQRTHSDLIRNCSTFREILSEDMAFSCDYSMLYYKGQCELYSSLMKHNKTEAMLEAKSDLSFCSDPSVDRYIQEHGLTDAPRSPTLVPGYNSPIA